MAYPQRDQWENVKWKQTNLHQVTPGAKEQDEDTNAWAATDKGDLIPIRKSDRGMRRCHARAKKNLEENVGPATVN